MLHSQLKQHIGQGAQQYRNQLSPMHSRAQPQPNTLPLHRVFLPLHPSLVQQLYLQTPNQVVRKEDQSNKPKILDHTL